MSTPIPFELEVLQALRDIKSDVSTLKSDVSELKTDVSTLKSDVSELKTDVSTLKSDVSELKSDMWEVKSRLWTLEENILDLRDEVRSENQATRALLNQAFEHLSDQIARDDHMSAPSMVFRPRSREEVTV